VSTSVSTARLGDPAVADVILGQSPPSSTYNKQGAGLPFYQGKADFGLVHPTPRIWCSEGSKFAKPGDVLMSVRAPVGDVNMATEDAVVGRGVSAIRAAEGVDPWYLYFSLTFMKPVLEAQATGSTFASVNGTTLRDLEIPYVPFEDQVAIGRLLRLLVTRIQQEETSLNTTAETRRAAMQQLFSRGLRGEAQKETEIGPIPESWELVELGEVREFLQYGTSVPCTLEPKHYPVLRIPNIEPGRVNGAELKYCDLPTAQAEKYLLAPGDLLFIRTNGVIDRLGSCAVYDGEPEAALFASYLIRARVQERALPKFVAYFYGSALGTSLVAGRATPASDGKYNLNTGTIDALPLPLPPTVEEQQEIVDVLGALDRKIDLHRRKRDVLDQLFKSLLHKLMTGEVSVDDLDLSALPSIEESAA
jgi:type I restriction enzyme, S subunit